MGLTERDLEPVITDWEMSVVEGRLRDAWRDAIPDDTDFVSWIQEPKTIERDGKAIEIARMAVFAVVSDHPTTPGAPRIMTHGTVSMEDFLQSRDERKHYVTAKPRPELIIFSAVVKQHMTTLQNLREIIH
jgi:hypothetical protein